MASGATPRAASTYAGALVALVLLIALTRWPLLTSPDLVLDGDEAIVGLMAMDLADGRRVPLYFDGQSFGISIVETGAIAAAFRLVGASTEAAKIAVLALWVFGWVLFVDALRLWVDRPTALVAGALLATMPAWGNWSMMARGYHLGGFVTAQVCFWWVARVRADGSTGSARMIVAGALLALLALTQALFLVGVLPFVGLMLAVRRRRRDWIGLAIGAGIVLLAGVAARFSQSSYWSPSYAGTLSILRAPLRVGSLLWTCLGGAYYYERRLPVSSATIVASALWVAAAAIALGRILTRMRRPSERIARGFELSAAGAFLAVLGAAALITPLELAEHHLLAATVTLVQHVAVMIREALQGTRVERAAAGTLSAALIVSGIIAIGDVPALWAARSSTTNAPQRADLTALVAALEDHGLKDVYCFDGMLQWNLMFASGGRISARWLEPVDRRPDAPMAVDRALWEGRPTALVGRVQQRPLIRRRLASAGLTDLELQTVGDTYFWMAQPTPAVLTALRFRLHEKESPTQPAGRERGMH